MIRFQPKALQRFINKCSLITETGECDRFYICIKTDAYDIDFTIDYLAITTIEFLLFIIINQIIEKFRIRSMMPTAKIKLCHSRIHRIDKGEDLISVIGAPIIHTVRVNPIHWVTVTITIRAQPNIRLCQWVYRNPSAQHRIIPTGTIVIPIQSGMSVQLLPVIFIRLDGICSTCRRSQQTAERIIVVRLLYRPILDEHGANISLMVTEIIMELTIRWCDITI